MDKELGILYLEDEENLEVAVKLYLELGGVLSRIVRVETLPDLESKLTSINFDIVLLDRYLPNADGFDALQLVRKHNPEIPVIMLSGGLDESDIVRALESGANDYLLKNNITRLADLVRKVLHDDSLNAHDEDEGFRGSEIDSDIVQNIVKHLPGGVYQFSRDSEGNYALPVISPQFQRLMGLSERDVKEDATLAFEQVHPDDVSAMLESIEESAVKMTDWDQEFRILKSDGSYLWVKGTSSPVEQQDGSILWSGILLDITKRKTAEEHLRKSESDLRAILNNMVETFYRTDNDGRFVMVSPSVEAMLGYHPDELIGRKLSDYYIEPVARGQFLKTLTDQGGIVTDYESPLKHKDGHEVWVSTCARYYRNEKGDIAGVEGTTRDISKRHDVEQTLQRTNNELERRVIERTDELDNSRAHIQAILDTAVDGVITIDKKGTVLSVNQAVKNIFGFDESELLGRNINVLMPEPYYSEHDGYLESYNSGNAPKVLGIGREVKGKRKNGEIFHLELGVSEVKAGNDIFFTGIVRDISRRVKAEEALKINEHRYRRSQAFANIGTWDWNIQTDELYWSQRIPALFGYPEGNLETTYDNFINAVHPDDRQAVIDAVNACVEHDVEYDIEHRCVWPSGEVRWLHERGAVIRDEDEAPLNMLGVVIDITRAKKSELALIDARDAAESANQSKSEFLSNMSHELRTPLNAILGFSQLLTIEGELSSEQNESVEEIDIAGKHLLELINEVLDLAKIEAGHISINNEDLELFDIVEECIGVIKPIASKRGISINDHRAGNVSSYTVCADRVRLKQAILNLLSNAIKYNREDGRVDVITQRVGKENVSISVKDTGVGLSADKLTELFKPFQRFNAEKEGIEGTGIGLVITKNLVEMMGGTIEVESCEGEGTTFTMTFLSHDIKADTQAEDVPDNVVAEESVSREVDENIPVKHVVYIEDNPANLKLIAKLFRRIPGVLLHSAHEPGLGIELINQHAPDLVLLDINLPGMSGIDVLKRLQQGTLHENTPVIAISANAMQKDIDDALAAGFEEYITKPVDIDEFFAVMNKYLL